MVRSIDVTLQSVEALKLQEDGARWVPLEVEDEPHDLFIPNAEAIPGCDGVEEP